jgi:hypothetical protein
MSNSKERNAFLQIAGAFSILSITQVQVLIRDAFRGMYGKKRSQKQDGKEKTTVGNEASRSG